MRRFPRLFLLAGILFLPGHLMLAESREGNPSSRTLTLIREKKKEVRSLISQQEAAQEEIVLRCLREKLKLLEELERAVLRATIEFTIQKEEARLKKIEWQGSLPAPSDEKTLLAFLSKAEGETIRIADEAYLCLNQEGQGAVFPRSERVEPPPRELPPLPFPSLTVLEPSPADRPFSPLTP